MKIKIQKRWIGEKNPVFVVAEGGINHNGSVKLAKKIIEKAKDSGADAVKFQTFKAEDLVSPKSKTFKIFKKVELAYEDFSELSDYAKSQKIIFLSTPFSTEAVDLLQKVGVPAFKIASGDLTDIPLIKYAASKKKPMIISTGMANVNEIKDAIKSIQSKNKKIIIMHSNSSYPTPTNETNLLSIRYLTKKFCYPIGYSDNGKDMLVPIIAVALGAKIIEKHFTINRKLAGPDQKLSADPSDLKNLIENIRLVEKMFGKEEKKCQPSELENIIVARRSITAKLAIKKDTKIQKNLVGLNRPATGIPPKYLGKIMGKKTKRPINAGQSIKWNDLR